MPAVLEPPRTIKSEQSGWFERTYQSLRDRYRRVDERTKETFQRWRRSGGESELLQIAAEKFPETEFLTVPDVPIFAEHTTTERSGKVVKYDRRALDAIVARCNERILDTGDFAPLTAGHTPTQEGLPFPEVLGYDGPFRVGILGNKKPRWAIFCDEHIRRDRLDEVRALPRRSPEVWAEPRMEDRILDPIAALGSETPRLDMGIVRFARAGDGRVVERYSSFVSAPSGMNTHIPGSEKQRYDAATPAGNSPEPEASMALQPQDIQQIAEAIMATKQWQWITEQMEQSQGEPGDATAAPDVSSAPADGDMTPDAGAPDPGMPPADATPAPAAAPAAPSPSPTPAAAPSMSPLSPEESAGMADDEKQQYSAMSHDGQCGYAAARRKYMAGSGPATMKYSRARHDQLESETETLRGRVAALEADKRQTERYSRLSTLAATHVFDLTDEAKHCEAMTDEQFAAHLTRVERYARHDDPTKVGYLPGIIAQVEPPEKEEDAAARRERYSRRAVVIAEASRRSGKHMSYDAAYAQAVAEKDE